MHEILIAVLTFAAVVSFGGTIVLARFRRQRRLKNRLGGQDATDRTPVDTKTPRAMGVVSNLGQTMMGRKGASATLKQQLARAGFYGPSAASIYMGVKLLLMLLGLGGLLALFLMTSLPTMLKVSLGLMGTGLLFLLPNLVVNSYRNKRTKAVRQFLPDAVDLMEVCVSSGMGMETAWNVVADEMRRVSTILADEMSLTNLEIHLGAQRMEAMRNLATRTGVEEIGSMVAVLAQSERFGTSIADALQTFGEAMRENRSARAQEAAEKMAVKLLLPLCVFIFPAVLVVMVGPAGVVLSKVMSNY